MMSKKRLRNIFLGLLTLLATSESYACYPGLDCPDDLPKSARQKTVIEEWKKIDRYLVKGGIVKDPITGVIWMRCSFGQTWEGESCQGKAARISWTQAQIIAENFDYAGYSDWELASILELKRLVFCNNEQPDTQDDNTAPVCVGDYNAPTVVHSVFPQTPNAKFWSSSLFNTDDAWVTDFATGSTDVDNKGRYNAVRLVRRGQ
jgi:hypothetical protein